MRFLFVIQADLALQSFSEGVTDYQQRGLREGLWLGQLPEGTAGLREVGRVVIVAGIQFPPLRILQTLVLSSSASERILQGTAPSEGKLWGTAGQ